MTELSNVETETVQALAQHNHKRVRFSVDDIDGKSQVKVGDNTTMDRLRVFGALGAKDLSFGNGLINQIANITPMDVADEANMNFILGFVREVEPLDQFEALLAVQMAASHLVAMDCARRTIASSHLKAIDGAANRMTKMTRTYIAQMEALKKHRAKASQVVRVERVEVKEGGQAIVGDVTHGGSEPKNVR